MSMRNTKKELLEEIKCASMDFKELLEAKATIEKENIERWRNGMKLKQEINELKKQIAELKLLNIARNKVADNMIKWYESNWTRKIYVEKIEN